MRKNTIFEHFLLCKLRKEPHNSRINPFYDTMKEMSTEKAEKTGKVFEAAFQSYKLTIEEKQRILLNNIYGVDIDSQAVQVT